MNILILEDEDEKYSNIAAAVQRAFSGRSLAIQRCEDLNTALMRLGSNNIDLFIADLVVPQMPGGDEVDATEQLGALLESEASARLITWIVITRFNSSLIGARETFAHHGVTVLDYNNEHRWRVALDEKLESLAGVEEYDFVIFCALEKERKAFENVSNAVLGERFNAKGLNCQKLSITNLNGVCIRTQQMGLVDSAIACAKALELFKPSAVAMAGICGGRASEVSIGTLIVPEMCWNYQTGKFKDGALQFEPNSVSIPTSVYTELAQLLADTPAMEKLQEGLTPDDVFKHDETMQPLVSGSAVIADASAIDTIGLQHRKVAGVDMEMYSVFRASMQFYDSRSVFFGAKAVVDLGDENKSDKYHEYGCILSARFVAAALEKLLAR
jgi:nucleoside phosphorylase